MKSIPFNTIATVGLLLALVVTAQARPTASDTTIHPQADGSRIIVERIPGVIEIPDPPEPIIRPEVAPQPSEKLIRMVEEWRAHREANPFIHAGASVYRLSDGRRITHVSRWSVNNRPPVSFWSAADFSLLAHSGEFTTSQGTRYSLLLMHSTRDVDDERKILVARRIESFPEGPAGWILAPDSAPADAATLAAIQAIHAHYEANHVALQVAYHKIEAERAARRTELEANPPLPRDVHLRVGRLSREQAADWHRHATQRTGGKE